MLVGNQTCSNRTDVCFAWMSPYVILFFSWKQQSLPLLALNNGLSGADVEHAVEHGHLQSIKHLEPNGLAYLL